MRVAAFVQTTTKPSMVRPREKERKSSPESVHRSLIEIKVSDWRANQPFPADGDLNRSGLALSSTGTMAIQRFTVCSRTIITIND
jgi:hypothetical protein